MGMGKLGKTTLDRTHCSRIMARSGDVYNGPESWFAGDAKL